MAQHGRAATSRTKARKEPRIARIARIKDRTKTVIAAPMMDLLNSG